MIRLVTYNYFRKISSESDSPIDALFSGLNIRNWPVQIKTLAKKLINVIDGITVVTEQFNLFQSKMTDNFIGLENLSTGCKTALVILDKILKNETGFVDISEVGSNALTVCLNLLDNSQLTGIISSPIHYLERYNTITFTLNGKEYHNWFVVISEVAKEMDDNVA